MTCGIGIGGACIGILAAGGGGSITEINGDTGPVVTLDAADVGALALDGSGVMTGNIAMGGGNVVGAGSVAATGSVTGATMTATTFNGVALTAGGSVSDSLRADGSYTAISVFGQEFQSEFTDTPVATTSGTPQDYLTLTTPVVPAGTYFVAASFMVSGSSQGTDIAVDLLLNGVALPNILVETGIAGGRFLFGGGNSPAFAAGVQVVVARFWRVGATGTVTAIFADLQLWRAT